MGLIVKKIVSIFSIILLAVITPATAELARSEEFTTQDRVSRFLSDVLGLDTTKYSIVRPNVPLIHSMDDEFLNNTLYSPEFGGQVKLEAPSFNFSYSSGYLNLLSVFYNGRLYALKNTSPRTSEFPNYVYSGSPPTDILNQAYSILQRYQTFVSREYSDDTSYFAPMQDILKTVNEPLPMEKIVGNIDFRITIDEIGDTHLKWIYTENGTSMEWKRIEMRFNKYALISFTDGWTIYKVGATNVLSYDEARKIALDAAQNYKLTVSYQNGTTKTIKVPNLSSATCDSSFDMLPYRSSSISLPSKISRDALALYPLWQFYFYFDNTIAGNYGIQVGVYGDTGEVAYCSEFGYFGAFDTANDGMQEPNLTGSSNLMAIVFVAVIIAIFVVSVLVLLLRHKTTRKKYC